jgi:cytochrome c553
MRQHFWGILTGLGIALGSVGVAAQTTQAEKSTLPSFEQRVQMCSACHGASGNAAPLPNTPTLAGQPKLFLENQLVLIREGMRDIPMMKGLLDGWSDDELVRMAQHFATQTIKPAPKPQDAKLLERGRQLAQDNRCGICHLPNYMGREQMPRLAGQREDYLLHSMRMMQANQATGRDPNMAASLHGLKDADLVAISHYLSQLK